MKAPVSRLRVVDDHDVVRMRRHARLITETVGLSVQDQTRFITALSEIARNAIQHGGGGSVDFQLRRESSHTLLESKVHDLGPGMDATENQPSPGLGLGMSGAKRLVHRFTMESGRSGTVIVLGMRLPSEERRGLREIAKAAADAVTDDAADNPHEELVRQNRALVDSLSEKDFLIREIHHRVKNNFQLISSLAQLQARRAQGEEAKRLLGSLAVRIRALGLAHEQLYMFEDLTRVSLRSFVGELCSSLKAAFVSPDQEIAVTCSVPEDLTLTQDEAIDLGVILNELVTNSIKHGFPDGRTGAIKMETQVTEDELILTVSDDGVGAPDFSFDNASDSLGMRLLNSSVRKLNGEIEFLPQDVGAMFRLTFPRSNSQGRAFQAVI